jgi:hypothetical protein
MIAALALAAAVAAAPAAAGDWSRLARAAGLTPAEAEGMTLTEVAGALFARGSDEGAAGRQALPYPVFGALPPRHLVAARGARPGEVRGLTLTRVSVRRVDLRAVRAGAARGSPGR